MNIIGDISNNYILQTEFMNILYLFGLFGPKVTR